MIRNTTSIVSFLAAILLAAPAGALINPKYTPVDLVRDSSVVLILRVSSPADGKMTAEVVEALGGAAPAEKKLTFDFGDADDLPADKVSAAFAGAPSAVGVMFIQKKKQDGALVGALEIGMLWMGLTQTDAKAIWKADRDSRDLETVWGGSARRLVPAVRYAITHPAPVFPVASTMTWGKDVSLGKLAGKAHGCLVTTDGAIVLSAGGDRAYQVGAANGQLADITEKLGLTSRSRAMAAGDFNGDGRPDLASWDGARFWLLLRGADGKFAAPVGGQELGDCLSLSAMRGGLVVGTSTGAKLIHLQDGAIAVKELPGGAGPCAVADINDDGLPDIAQVSPDSLTIHAGQGKAGEFAAPVTTKLGILKKPAAILCGDFDLDGQLDLLVTGEGGAAMLSREDGQWKHILAQTGEFGAAAGQADSVVTAACLTDVNGDGLQGIALFQAAASPTAFFNRGFAAFGLARTLVVAEATQPGLLALGSGQATGMLRDLSGDGVPDLLAVDHQNGVWVVLGEAKDPRENQLMLATKVGGPVAVTVTFGKRQIGMWVVRAGEPTTIVLPEAGKATLRWKAADGSEYTSATMVEGAAKAQVP